MLIFIMNITRAYADTLHRLSLIASTERIEISIILYVSDCRISESLMLRSPIKTGS